MDRRVKERLVGASILVVLIVLIVPELLSGPKPKPGLATAPRLPAASAHDPVRNVTVDLATSKPTASDAPSEATAGNPEPAASAASPGLSDAGGGASAAVPNGAATSGGTASGGRVANSGGASAEVARPAGTLETPGVSPTSPVAAARGGGPSEAGTGRSDATPARSEPGGRRPDAMAAHLDAGSTPTDMGRHSWAVQLGSFASRANADKLAHQLKAQGFSVYVMPGGAGRPLRYRVRVGPLADRAGAAQTVVKLKGLGHPSSVVAPTT